MFSNTLFLAVAAISTVASAQNYSIVNGQPMVDVTQLGSGERQSWCLGQRNNCPKVCEGPANPNSCDLNTLQWACTCTNGNKPNITDYAEMIPFYLCEQYEANCVASNPDDSTAQFACRSFTCGSKNASALAVDSSSSSSSASASATASSSGRPSGTQATASAATTSATGAAAALNVAKSYGSGILATGLLAIFGLAL